MKEKIKKFIKDHRMEIGTITVSAIASMGLILYLTRRTSSIRNLEELMFAKSNFDILRDDVDIKDFFITVLYEDGDTGCVYDIHAVAEKLMGQIS